MKYEVTVENTKNGKVKKVTGAGCWNLTEGEPG